MNGYFRGNFIVYAIAGIYSEKTVFGKYGFIKDDRPREASLTESLNNYHKREEDINKAIHEKISNPWFLQDIVSRINNLQLGV